MEDIFRSIKNLSSKINRKYPDVELRSMERYESLVEKLVKNGKKSNIDTRDKEILEELLTTIENLRKDQDEPDEMIDMFMLMLDFTKVLIDNIGNNK